MENAISCVALSHAYTLNPVWMRPAVWNLNPGFCAAAQFHALVLSAFASIIAPFGGFFASGFKRGFKIKDFGDSIPGHGGMTDRMDCQVRP